MELPPGVTYGHGNATSCISGCDDEVTFDSNMAQFNARGIGNAGYVYLENSTQNQSYAVGSDGDPSSGFINGNVKMLRWDGSGWSK